MKAHLLALAAAQPDPRARLNLVREYLQAHILASLQTAGAFAALAFHGGTALRVLHGLRRFSEDLDFSLERPAERLDLADLARKAGRDLELSGYAIEVTVRTAGAVHAAHVKFPGLLRDVGLTTDPRRKLAVRLDVDTRPPAGAVSEQRLVTRHFPIVFRAHDLASCMAGKLHALLTRGHAKGRDVYDLAWFMTHPARPEPNVEYLRNALRQTRWSGPDLGPDTWRRVLIERLGALDWPAVVRDVEPFLEDPRDMLLLDRDLISSELRSADRGTA